MRVGLAFGVPAFALLVGCSSGSAPRSAAPAATGVVVAVSRHADAGIQLYRIGSRRRAQLVRDVRPPSPDRHAVSWTLSGGPHPDLCVVWDLESDGYYGELRCYPFGAGGRTVGLVKGNAAVDVALRADGRALAWTTTTGEAGEAQDVVVGDYDHGRVTNAHALKKGPEDWTGGLAWVNDHVLGLERPLMNDQPGGFELVDLNKIPPSGWGSVAFSIDPEPAEVASGYDYFTAVRSATNDWALAVEGTTCDATCPRHRPNRAVRVELGSGHLIEVVATPAQGRVVTSVSGGLSGIVYVTRGVKDVRVYLRLRSEQHGMPVGGLPGDVEDVVADP